MKTIKKVILLILLLLAVMAIFTITVKATTNLKQENTIEEQNIENSISNLKEPEKTPSLKKKEESSKVETKTQEETQAKEAKTGEEVITEIMDPNNKAEVVQYEKGENEQAIEESNN